MKLQDRLMCVRGAMRQAGLDLLVAASSGFHMIDKPNPVDWLSGFKSLGPSLVLVFNSGDLELIATPAADADRLEAERSGVVGLATDDLVGALRAALASRSLKNVGCIGMGAMPHRLAGALGETLGAGVIDVDDRIFAAAGAKTDDEIEHARAATAIAESGYALMRELARPGLRECDLAVALNLHMREQGADDSFLLLNAGPRSEAVAPSSERAIEAGDLILVELSPSVKGQFVQICRTLCVGPAPPLTRAKYELLAAAMGEGLAIVRPGVRMAQVCQAINDRLSREGYAAYSQPPFIRRRGHGLGAGSILPGDVALDNDCVLEPGMLFMVHPNQFLPETGYMMCGEPVLVLADGAEVLTRRMAQLDEIAI